MPLIGSKELTRALRDLEKKGKDCVRKAQRDAAKVEQAAWIAAAPVKSGATKAAIKVRTAKASRKSIGTVVVIGAEWFKGKVFYAAFLMFGHHIGKRKYSNKEKQQEYEEVHDARRQFIPGTNWAKKAWDAAAQRATEVWENNMKKYVEKAVEESRGK